VSRFCEGNDVGIMLRRIAGITAVMCGGVVVAVGAGAQAPSPLSPEGIYADSNARLPQVKRTDLSEADRRVFDSLTRPGARYANGMRGPAAMWMYSPDFAEKATALGEVVRNSPILGTMLTELAIVAVGVEVQDMTEVQGHARGALAAGLSEATLKVVRERRSTVGLDPKEATVIDFTRQVVSLHALDRETFERARDLFGAKGITDLQGLIGHYLLCNATNATFDIRPR
jgi:4-carboxymuconolactone decarboxylase